VTAGAEALAGVDDVPWELLSHANGLADDVPGLLAALVDGPEHARDEALITLFDYLWNDGVVFEATAQAVPFLARIAGTPGLPRRSQVLDLLGRIVRASAFPEVDDPLHAREDRLGRTSTLPIEVEWATRAKAAVGASEPSWVALLDDPDAEVRGTAAFVLSGLDELATSSVEALARHAEREPDDSARAAMLVALSEVDGHDAPSLLASALKSTTKVVRFAAAVALGRLGFPSDTEVVVDLLVAAIRDPDRIDPEWQLVPGAESVSADARDALVTLAPGEARFAIGPLLEALPLESCDAYQALRALLELVFPEQGRVLSDDELSAMQRTTLVHIVAADPVWADAGDHYVVRRWLEARGLPGSREQLRWFVNGMV